MYFSGWVAITGFIDALVHVNFSINKLRLILREDWEATRPLKEHVFPKNSKFFLRKKNSVNTIMYELRTKTIEYLI